MERTRCVFAKDRTGKELGLRCAGGPGCRPIRQTEAYRQPRPAPGMPVRSSEGCCCPPAAQSPFTGGSAGRGFWEGSGSRVPHSLGSPHLLEANIFLQPQNRHCPAAAAAPRGPSLRCGPGTGTASGGRVVMLPSVSRLEQASASFQPKTCN